VKALLKGLKRNYSQAFHTFRSFRIIFGIGNVQRHLLSDPKFRENRSIERHIAHLRHECHNSKFGIFELLV
jgi:hypothetical protein